MTRIDIVKLSLILGLWGLVMAVFIISICSMYPPEDSHLMSTTDLQQELVRRGYDIQVDGRVGTLTQTAWDTEIIKQYTEEAMTLCLDPNTQTTSK